MFPRVHPSLTVPGSTVFRQSGIAAVNVRGNEEYRRSFEEYAPLGDHVANVSRDLVARAQVVLAAGELEKRHVLRTPFDLYASARFDRVGLRMRTPSDAIAILRHRGTPGLSVLLRHLPEFVTWKQSIPADLISPEERTDEGHVLFDGEILTGKVAFLGSMAFDLVDLYGQSITMLYNRDMNALAVDERLFGLGAVQLVQPDGTDRIVAELRRAGEQAPRPSLHLAHARGDSDLIRDVPR